MSSRRGKGKRKGKGKEGMGNEARRIAGLARRVIDLLLWRRNECKRGYASWCRNTIYPSIRKSKKRMNERPAPTHHDMYLSPYRNVKKIFVM